MPDSPEFRAPDASGQRIGTTDARQAVTGTGAKYVLHIGLALAVIALVIVYFVIVR